MNDSDIESLIRSINEVEAFERAAPPELRDPTCLSMIRLDALADRARAPTAAERAHLRACRVCDRRLSAFRSLSGGHTSNPSTRHRRWLQLGAAMATAACLALLLSLDRGAKPSAVQPPPRIPLNIEYTARAVSAGERCTARFRNTAGENCVMLAIFRAWDGACECRQWQLYDWGRNGASALAAAGRPLDILIDTTNMPAIEQLLVVALARNADELPNDETETEALLACLNSSPLETERPDDITGFATAVESCLPPGVTVVSHAFNTD